MPKIDLSQIPVISKTGYPPPHHKAVDGRHTQRLGAESGITQFGANLVTLDPGAKSSLRHWHEEQDEFLMVTEGELTLVDDTGSTRMGPGDCAAFPAGDANGHHMVNRSEALGRFLVIGTHTATETGHYSDVDMMVKARDGQFTFTRRDGTPLIDPDAVFQPLSEALTRALIIGDFALYRSVFVLPTQVRKRGSDSYELITTEELKADFQLYRKSIATHSVTDIFREVLSTEFSEDGRRCHVHTRVRILSGTTLVLDPFHVDFDLEKTTEGWRIRGLTSATEHIDWTLGHWQ
ncbi:cupin domain-containing protein [Pacificoceanicola onchidii]|uniref:cupin domain-containing protein n=1 Tax=Pacificoceanicola onchidii TaxID=2562685 RepID=UPI0010A498E1